MDPESKKLLQNTFELTRENNDILHSMRHSMRMARIMSYLYWIFIIGASFGAFYLIQPYLDAITGGASGAKTNFNDVINGFKQLNQ